MSGLITHEPSTQARTFGGRREAHGAVVADIRARGRTEQQRNAAERMMRHLSRLQERHGDKIDLTWRQLAKGLGLPTEGLTNRQCQNAYRGSMMRTLRYLTEWGYLEGYKALYEPSGEGRCIVITLVAGVAQSVRAAANGGGPPRRRGGDGRDPERHFFSGEVYAPVPAPPLAVDVAVVPEESISKPSLNGGASARSCSNLEGTPGERFLVHAARRQASVKAAVAVSLVVAKAGIERAGPELAALPAVRDAPVTAVCRVLFSEALPDVPPAISAKRQAQLEAAARRIDRYSGGEGEWIRYACQVIAGWAEDGRHVWLTDPPRSLGALALELRREANMRRYGALRRRAERLRPLAAMHERAGIKQRRQERRELERDFGRLAVRKRRP